MSIDRSQKVRITRKGHSITFERMWKLHQIVHFLSYYLQAKPPRRMHSPYMYDLLTKVFDDHKSYYIFEEIEKVRRDFSQSRRRVQSLDYGAGSHKLSGNSRTESDIVGSAVSSSRKCEVLFRLTEHLQPAVTVEVGASLGISSAYIAAANSNGRIYSFEGNPDLANTARDLSRKLNLNNIDVRDGNFDDSLPACLDSLESVDLAYIDGNHRKEPTLRYFDMLCAKRGPEAVFIIDDIRWSREMYETWCELLQNDAVRASVDAFSFGMLFFSPVFKESLDLTVTPSRLAGGPILR